jgi:hypothetical protein
VPWTVEKHVHILLDDEAVLNGIHFHINSKHDAVNVLLVYVAADNEAATYCQNGSNM